MNRSTQRLLAFIFLIALAGYNHFVRQPASKPSRNSGTRSSRPHNERQSRPRTAQRPPQPTGPSDLNSAPGVDNSNFLLGNPTNAGTFPDNYLVARPQPVMSYHRSRGKANWVAWHTDASNLGNVKRGTFRPDPLLPPDSQIRPNDYTGSGYDRGHVCPSGDRNDTRDDNDATFVMSNMLPQTAALNQHV